MTTPTTGEREPHKCSRCDVADSSVQWDGDFAYHNNSVGCFYALCKDRDALRADLARVTAQLATAQRAAAGLREPSIITLMRQDLLRGEDMPASDLRVLAYVDALRADLARVTAERDEDRRDYAADTAMAVACIEALREVRPEWESLFYATEESKMEDCAAFTIRQLADALATAQREAAGLREELTQYRNDLLECRDEERSARRMLQSLNYRRCDIPACNCGSWHLLTPAPEAGR